VIDPSRVAVRPTKRCLDDLELKFPPIQRPLYELDHPVVRKAQQVPLEVAAGGAERILALSDLVWLKVKVGQSRAIVTELARTSDVRDEIRDSGAWWWVGAAGTRRQDSCDDFYKVLTVECERRGRTTGGPSSVHLLPADIDMKRLSAEAAAQTVLSIKKLVCGLIARSISTGKTWRGELRRHTVSATVRAQDGEAYLLISAEGFLDSSLLAVILAAVPGVDPTEWLPEPKGVFGFEPAPGQILYSTMISAAAQAGIVAAFLPDEDEGFA
jgi:hypothetical protein